MYYYRDIKGHLSTAAVQDKYPEKILIHNQRVYVDN